MQFADWFTVGFGVTIGIACATFIACLIVALVQMLLCD